MDAGKLNKRISIKGMVEVDTVCGIQQQLKEIKKLWACKIDLDKGTEYIESKQTVQKVISKFIVRRSDWITQSMFITYKKHDYDIVDILEKDNDYTVLFAQIKTVGEVDEDE
ncbi:head-tail adaptor protein [Clostridium botulinum]|uniref:head-tail adaptor protein n=1 Tax=Clostridium botulinum TaxID=1491 RepID=UPI001E33648F|nr:head-tail adaptor protein [Clostridium botulinum]MCD3223942.1 head-tail adaptor protein [Clostridium botulinum C/D]MCD3296291.1 head-tail adaptor protein [Clostridium botulinum C/D]